MGLLRTLSPSFAAALARLEQVARADVPVHLSGETGTGKELAARALHAASGRPGPLVAVNCGAIAATLLESELFGHRRGAFSGALEDRPGLVRSAHGGTLFLDEVTDLSPAAQGALLRVLQEREVLPVGGTRALPVDVRFCSAANQPLDEAIRTGRLRADLVARLFGFRLRLPPLRERREDLGLLCAALLGRIAGPEAPRARLSREAARALLAAPWPLNVRALEHALATAWALGHAEGTLTLAHFGDTVTALADPPAPPTTAPAATKPGAPPADAHDPRATELEALLKAHGGNLTAVARVLGRDRALVRRWLRRYGIDPDRYRA
jgi:DNA-binding NtrC family response regulator